MPINPLVQALTQRCQRNGAAPLLTWYEPSTGARTELSGRTFANWVDKTVNLLAELEPSGPIAGEITLHHPGHWMSLIWPMAAWQFGAGYLAGPATGESDLVIVGPESPTARPGVTTLACSLHPLGLGLPGLPPGVIDFSTEALAQPDAHFSNPVSAEATAWLGSGNSRSHAETGAVQPSAARRLVRPGDGWETFAAALAAPLLGGGSSVIVTGPASPAQLEQIGGSEHATEAMA